MKGEDDKEEDEIFRNANSWPPGFRFHPTDEELVLYYLKRKICNQRLKLDVINEIDVYKWDPEELPGQSILKSRDRQWYFFTTRDRKYPNAARSNRATRHGYWKATGKDRIITWNSRSVGVKKTLVFYKGRAPSGERTDWVMHEYTMDENELQRCKNVQDYYALCKLFKKSGPGPKNGEQYGAPFREEDWVDEDEVIENHTHEKVNQVHQNGYSFIENASKSSKPLVEDIDQLFRQIAEEAELYTPPIKENTFRPSQVGCEQYGAPFREEDWVDEDEVIENHTHEKVNQVHQNGYSFIENASKSSKPLVEDIDQLFRQIAEEAELYTPLIKENTFRPSQIGAKEETWSTIMGPSHEEITSFAPLSWNPHQNQHTVHESFTGTQSSLSYLPSCEAPEVTSASKYSEWNSPNNELLDYLEINDLEGPQKLGFSNMNGGSGNSQFEQGEVWNESDIFLDADMFLPEDATFNQNSLLEPDIFNLAGDFSYQESGQRLTLGYNGDQSTDELWIQDQKFDFSAPVEPYQAARPPTTGGLTNHTEEVHNRVHGENGDIDSWLRSSISALLDSVPARPALASESELINRAFQRMSSFGKLTASAIDLGAGARGLPVAGKMFSRNAGLLFFSVLGVVCAVLYMWRVGVIPKNLAFS